MAKKQTKSNQNRTASRFQYQEINLVKTTLTKCQLKISKQHSSPPKLFTKPLMKAVTSWKERKRLLDSEEGRKIAQTLSLASKHSQLKLYQATQCYSEPWGTFTRARYTLTRVLFWYLLRGDSAHSLMVTV